MANYHPLMVQLLIPNRNDGNEVENSKLFLSKIRQYNSILAFASVIAQLNVPPGTHQFVYRIQGSIYHNVPPLLPNQHEPQTVQFYVMDSEVAHAERMRINIDQDLDDNVNILYSVFSLYDTLMFSI